MHQIAIVLIQITVSIYRTRLLLYCELMIFAQPTIICTIVFPRNSQSRRQAFIKIFSSIVVDARNGKESAADDDDRFGWAHFIMLYWDSVHFTRRAKWSKVNALCVDGR